MHVAQLESTIKELQDGADKATETAETAAAGKRERSAQVHDEPVDTASMADSPGGGLLNVQGNNPMRTAHHARSFI